MSDKDYAIAATQRIVSGSPILNKPAHLITFVSTTAAKTKQLFLTIEKPEFENHFVHVKGIFTDLSEDSIANTFSELLTEAIKESSLTEMYFPIHRISSMKNLVFRSNKK
jgi:hypothetical protein